MNEGNSKCYWIWKLHGNCWWCAVLARTFHPVQPKAWSDRFALLPLWPSKELPLIRMYYSLCTFQLVNVYLWFTSINHKNPKTDQTKKNLWAASECDCRRVCDFIVVNMLQCDALMTWIIVLERVLTCYIPHPNIFFWIYMSRWILLDLS